MTNHADSMVEDRMAVLRGLKEEGTLVTITLNGKFRHFCTIGGVEGDRVKVEVRDPEDPRIILFEINPYLDDITGSPRMGCHL